jgi:hypothetical protein
MKSADDNDLNVRTKRRNMPIKSTIKVVGATVLVLLLLFCALGPAKWQYRTGLGWQIDHVVGYFGFITGIGRTGQPAMGSGPMPPSWASRADFI